MTSFLTAHRNLHAFCFGVYVSVLGFFAFGLVLDVSAGFCLAVLPVAVGCVAQGVLPFRGLVYAAFCFLAGPAGSSVPSDPWASYMNAKNSKPTLRAAASRSRWTDCGLDLSQFALDSLPGVACISPDSFAEKSLWDCSS